LKNLIKTIEFVTFMRDEIEDDDYTTPDRTRIAHIAERTAYGCVLQFLNELLLKEAIKNNVPTT